MRDMTSLSDMYVRVCVCVCVTHTAGPSLYVPLSTTENAAVPNSHLSEGHNWASLLRVMFSDTVKCYDRIQRNFACYGSAGNREEHNFKILQKNPNIPQNSYNKTN